MSGRVSEDGLSEVIGFILIIGVLVVVASLYMTYMVPAQGRETEIGHMDYIKQQFLDYKISTDALWINNAIGTSISQAIQLGTQEGKTTGMFANFQLLQPVSSSGEMVVNPNDRLEKINIQASGVTKENPVLLGVGINPPPVINSIYPASAVIGTSDPISLHVLGSGFVDPDSEIFWNDEKITAIYGTDNAHELIATIQSTELTKTGVNTIHVETVGGGRSDTHTFVVTNKDDYPIPSIRSVTATGTASIGNSIPLSIAGDNFLDSSVYWNGNKVPGGPFSENPIIITIPASMVTESGISTVMVHNPYPGGGGSNAYGVPVGVSGGSPPPKINYVTPAYIAPSTATSLKVVGTGFQAGSVVLIDGVEKPSSFSAPDLSCTISTTDYTNNGLHTVIVRNPDGTRSDGVTYSDIIVKDGALTTTNLVNLDKAPNNYLLYFSTNADTNEKITVAYNDFPTPYGITLTSDDGLITININAVPRIITSTYRITDFTDYNLEFTDDTRLYNIRYNTDLTMDIYKGGTVILNNHIIQSNIETNTVDDPHIYTIDLMDPSYGIAPDLNYPSRFIAEINNPNNQYFDVVSSILSDMSNEYISQSHALGSLEYRSQNKYYSVQENFIYQIGGIFISQAEGSSVSTIPSIGITRTGEILDVNIADILITGNGGIAGSSPVLVSSILNRISDHNLFENGANAKTVVIEVDPVDDISNTLWTNTLNAIYANAIKNGVPDSDSDPWIKVENNPPRIIIYGIDNSDIADIRLNLKSIDMGVSLNAVGQSIAI